MLLSACTRIESDVEPPALQASPTSIEQPLRCVAERYPIVLTSTRGDSANGLELYLIDFDGQVLQVGYGARFIAPVWSPDGSAVAFRHQVPKIPGLTITSEVQLIAPDGNERLSLTPQETLPFVDDSVLPVDGPSWSPDGQSLAYAVADGAGGHGIWQIPRAGGEPRRLLAALPGSHHSAAWAPTPGVIAFVVEEDGVEDVWIANVDQPELPAVNLTKGRLQKPRSPRWSPDGQRLAFSALDPLSPCIGCADFEVYSVDLNTFDIMPVTQNEVHDLHPVWSPDGSELLVTRGRSPVDADTGPLDTLRFEVWRAPLADSARAQRVASEGWMNCGADWFSGRCGPP
jgi:Tol biopolymer transport system component